MPPQLSGIRTDAVLAMRSRSNMSILSQAAFNEAGVLRMMASRDGRGMASVTSFSAVRVLFNDNIKAYSS